MSHPAVVYEDLLQKCTSAGQQHILADWDSLNDIQQQQLAAEIRVSALDAFAAAEQKCCCSLANSDLAKHDGFVGRPVLQSISYLRKCLVVGFLLVELLAQ